MTATTTTRHSENRMAQFRKKVTEEIYDLEENGWQLVLAADDNPIFTRYYQHKRSKKRLSIEIDYGNLVAQLKVSGRLKKLIV